MISAAIYMLPHWVWHLCNLSCVYALFKLISIARYAFESPWITFEEAKHEIYRGHVAYLPSILWRRARLWLKLFANTVGRFLLRITSLSLYVFFRMVFPERSRTIAIERLSLTLRGLSLRQTANGKRQNDSTLLQIPSSEATKKGWKNDQRTANVQMPRTVEVV